MPRARREYRRRSAAPPPAPPEVPGRTVVPALDADPEALAVLLLDAYRGTIDDEGEDAADARAAIDSHLARARPAASLVVTEGGQPVALSFVVVVRGRHYIDPVATSPSHKRRGLGTAAVSLSLRRLLADGVDEVGAVITDGNVASERLFGRLGFTRVGAWG